MQTVKCHVHTASDERGGLVFSFYVLKSTVQKRKVGTILMVQGLRVCLGMQGTWVQFLAEELSSYMPRSNYAHMPQLESLSTAKKDPS